MESNVQSITDELISAVQALAQASADHAFAEKEQEAFADELRYAVHDVLEENWPEGAEVLFGNGEHRWVDCGSTGYFEWGDKAEAAIYNYLAFDELDAEHLPFTLVDGAMGVLLDIHELIESMKVENAEHLTALDERERRTAEEVAELQRRVEPLAEAFSRSGPTPAELFRLLREWRTATGTTTRGAALFLGVSPATITRYENGTRTPSAANIRNLTAAIGAMVARPLTWGGGTRAERAERAAGPDPILEVVFAPDTPLGQAANIEEVRAQLGDNAQSAIEALPPEQLTRLALRIPTQDAFEAVLLWLAAAPKLDGPGVEERV